MVSFLVISDNSEKADTWIKDTISYYKIHKFDAAFVEKDGGEKNTIGIEQIRLIQKNLSLRPLQGKTKAVIIKAAELLTLEAQNALLKTLEEPPRDTIIILAARQKDILIPTIVSRCRVIDLGFETPTLSSDENSQYQVLIKSLQEWGVGDRLKQAETIAKDKQEAILFLEKMILAGRVQLINQLLTDKKLHTSYPDSNSVITLLHCLSAFQDAHKILSTTNVNPRFALEHMFLSLSV